MAFDLDINKMSLFDFLKPTLAETFDQLDIRIGKITECVGHKTNDKLYIETVDVGERFSKKASSELANRYSIEQLVGRKVLVLCNANPLDKRGTDRTAMLVCAEKDGELELLNPPSDSQAGDYIDVEGYIRNPLSMPIRAEVMALYEKTPFFLVSADMKIDSCGLATYRGLPLQVRDRQGFITADSFTDCGIKFE